MQSQNQFYFLMLLCVIGISIDSLSFVLFSIGLTLTVSVAIFALGHSQQDPREKLRGATVANREYLMEIHLKKMARKLSLHQALIGRGIRLTGRPAIENPHSNGLLSRCVIVNVAGEN